MKSWIGLIGSLALLSSAGADWELQRFEGRDYVTLKSVAEFYDLSAPPALLATTPGRVVVMDVLPEVPTALPLPVLMPSDRVAMNSAKRQLTLTLRGREAFIDGVAHWLAYPILIQDGQALVSRLDLTKVIEPHLRPELIGGLGAVETVVLDPGHGGQDRGAVSRLGFEKDFALDVARRARPLLEKQGYKVVLTRDSDVFVPLHERAAVANGISNSIFVSIHFNQTSSNSSARGFEIYSMAPRGAPATNDQRQSLADLREEPGNALEIPSAALAGTVYTSILGHLPIGDRGMKHARFAVLRMSTVPAVLVECGFVSNADDLSLIDSGRWRGQLAEAISDGIDGYKLLAEKRRTPKSVVEYRSSSEH